MLYTIAINPYRNHNHDYNHWFSTIRQLILTKATTQSLAIWEKHGDTTGVNLGESRFQHPSTSNLWGDFWDWATGFDPVITWVPSITVDYIDLSVGWLLTSALLAVADYCKTSGLELWCTTKNHGDQTWIAMINAITSPFFFPIPSPFLHYLQICILRTASPFIFDHIVMVSVGSHHHH